MKGELAIPEYVKVLWLLKQFIYIYIFYILFLIILTYEILIKYKYFILF